MVISFGPIKCNGPKQIHSLMNLCKCEMIVFPTRLPMNRIELVNPGFVKTRGMATIKIIFSEVSLRMYVG